MKVVCIPNGQFIENCYLVIEEASRHCAVIDPGEDADLISRTVAAEGAQPVAIWLTHAHIDHVLGVPRVKADTGAPVFLHPADRPLYDAMPQQALAFGMRAAPLPVPDRPLAHGDVLRVGGLAFEVRHAPGHSPGHVVLVGHGAAFGGDVVFAGSIGRTDLPGGDFETLMASIEREVLSLPDDTILYPGHGPETTVGRERRTNPFLNGVYRVA